MSKNRWLWVRGPGWLRLWRNGPGLAWKLASEPMLFSERNGFVWSRVIGRWRVHYVKRWHHV